MSPLQRDGLLTAVLVFVTIVAAVVSSLGAPLIPDIAEQLHLPLADAQWSLTVALLAGAVSAPVMGRLGDGPHRRATLAGGLAVVALGGVVSALAETLPVLIVGRLMQGIGLGLVPLAMAAARDHLPAGKVPSVVALLSVSAAAGVGAGYPITGLFAESLGLHAAFWLGAGVSALALVAVLAVLPSSTSARPVPLDGPGALLLTGALVALLLGIAEGNDWGWSSARIVVLFCAAAVLLAAWVAQQLRARSPLVELRLLRRRTVLTADACALVLGVAMYVFLSLVTEFVQTPSSAGYGFDATTLVAGLCLVPFSICTLLASRALPWLDRTIGPDAILPLGSLVVGAAGAFFAFAHDALWQAFVTMGIVGVGLGCTFAAIPGMIVRAVPAHETGSAMGFYQVVRCVGFSLGSALAASILSSHTPSGEHLPTVGGYTLALWVAAGVCVLAAAIAWALPERGAPPPDPALERALEEDAEVAAAGLASV